MTGRFKERPDLDHFRVTLTSKTRRTREIFLNMVENGARAVEEEASVGDQDYRFGRFSAEMRMVNKKPRVSNVDLVLVERDLRGAPPISRLAIRRHEATEMFELAQRIGKYENCPDEYVESEECHQLALIAEFELAIKNGKGRQHLRFMLSKVEGLDIVEREMFEQENLWAYEMAMAKAQRRHSSR